MKPLTFHSTVSKSLSETRLLKIKFPDTASHRLSDAAVFSNLVLPPFPLTWNYFRLPGRWGPADRLHQDAPALHELHHLLHRLPLPPALGLSLPLPGLPIYAPHLPPGQDLQVLGVPGQDGAAHQLPQPVQGGQPHTLPPRGLPLELVRVLPVAQQERVRRRGGRLWEKVHQILKRKGRAWLHLGPASLAGGWSCDRSQIVMSDYEGGEGGEWTQQWKSWYTLYTRMDRKDTRWLVCIEKRLSIFPIIIGQTSLIDSLVLQNRKSHNDSPCVVYTPTSCPYMQYNIWALLHCLILTCMNKNRFDKYTFIHGWV